jgi:hypothetical protein
VTLRNAPLCGTGCANQEADLVESRSRIFLQKGLDSQITDLPVGLKMQGRSRQLESRSMPIKVATPGRSLTNSSVAPFAKFEHGRIVRGIAAEARLFPATTARGDI